MSILNKLASSLGRRDEIPNQELAKQIVKEKDRKAVKELVENLSGKSKSIQSDCIKVLYEIGELKPELIAPYCAEFAGILESKNNRLAWGAMTALDAIALHNSEDIYKLLPRIVAAADNGSVITRDHAVGILSKLGTIKSYSSDCFPLLMEQLIKCPVNQLPMYVEKSAAVINDRNKKEFIKTVSSRVRDLKKDSQRKRIDKVLKKFVI